MPRGRPDPRPVMSRETCYRCFWPKPLCWCGSITPMGTSTRFVFLMHPKEFKHEKAATGRLTHLCLENSEIIVGVGFDEDERVREIVQDPDAYPVLLYPGKEALNLSVNALRPPDLQGRRRVIFLIDATWSLGKKMLRLSTVLQGLPKIMFTPEQPSRFVIKQQPQPGCLSTLEATHETLLALENCGLDRYPLPGQLLALFARMQDFQIRCATDPARPGYRRKPYSDPSQRTPLHGRSGARRNRFIPVL